MCQIVQIRESNFKSSFQRLSYKVMETDQYEVEFQYKTIIYSHFQGLLELNPQNENTDSTKKAVSQRDGESKLGVLVSKNGLIRCMRGVIGTISA